MLEEVETVEGRANREFRLKFPDEIVTENLGGQLWFGAECLAAGNVKGMLYLDSYKQPFFRR
jgi:hypothetical protein